MPETDSPKSTLIVEHARWTDLQEVAALQILAFRPKLAYSFWTLALLKVLPGAKFVVGKVEGRVVGCALGDVQNGRGRVVNICVDPAARGNGYGRMLLTALEGLLPARPVILMVEESNDVARQLYASSGYDYLSLARDYYGKGLNGIWMEKRAAVDNVDAPRILHV